ncbi:MAG: GNAT family N-acetyltransferase [Planctomycetes bacterium]|nr:GNAT family N-acetyltransferase [Planctomycetota bacterium]
MSTPTTQCVVRDAQAGDFDGIVALDLLRAGVEKRGYWRDILDRYQGSAGNVALVAIHGSPEVVGFLFGEVRAWEFGSDRCGWIFSVAVSPDHERRGIAAALCDAAIQRFAEHGVDVVRTMVRRNDVPVLSFFRSQGFSGGPFSELECSIAQYLGSRP